MGVEDRFRRLEYRSESDLSYDESKRSERSFLNGAILRIFPRKEKFCEITITTINRARIVSCVYNEILINVSKQEETLANSFSTFIIIHLSLAELKQRRSR